jgi:formylglycine-generating enzyme required for sulfatase activity
MALARLLFCILAVVASLLATESRPDEAETVSARAADPMLGKKAGEVRDDNGLKMKLIWCPPGVVAMEQVERAKGHAADDDEANQADLKDKPPPKPVRVLLSRGYWIGKCEVTQIEWKRIMALEPWKGDRSVKEGDDYPAADISWNDATAFCRNLTKLEREADRLPADWEYALPTEAQWERACRARTETQFSFGDDQSKLGDYAWFRNNAWHAGEKYPHRVGQKKANPWGLCDMHGNVREWCWDIYAEKLPGGRDPDVQPDAKSDGLFRVFRGGCWADSAEFCRSADRFRDSPSHRSNVLGFRVALSAVRQAKPLPPLVDVPRAIDE